MTLFQRHVIDDLAAFDDGTLDTARGARVQRHLNDCADCRAALQDIRRGRLLLQSLSATTMSPSEVARLTSRLRQPTRTSPSRRRRLAVAAAIVLFALAGAFVVRLSMTSAPEIVATPESLGLERAAADLHERLRAGTETIQFVSASPPGVRGWLRARGAPEAQLADLVPRGTLPELGLRGASVIALGEARASVVAYDVDGYAVTLVTARESEVPSAPPSGWLTKRVHARRNANGRSTLTWSTSGQTYSIVSDLPGLGEHACLACHADAAFRRTLEAEARTAVQRLP